MKTLKMRITAVVLMTLLGFTSAEAGLMKFLVKSYKTTKGTKGKNINSKLAGSTHPTTGVRYVQTARGVYPIFKSAAICTMNLSFMDMAKDAKNLSNAARRSKHNKICNNQLFHAVKSNPAMSRRFTADQKRQIRKGKTPNGYTWHHNEKKNIMELVDAKIHNASAHNGGYSLHY